MIGILGSIINITMGRKEGRRGKLYDQLMSMRIFNLSLDIKPEKYEESGYGLYYDMLIVLY